MLGLRHLLGCTMQSSIPKLCVQTQAYTRDSCTHVPTMQTCGHVRMSNGCIHQESVTATMSVRSLQSKYQSKPPPKVQQPKQTQNGKQACTAKGKHAQQQQSSPTRLHAWVVSHGTSRLVLRGATTRVCGARTETGRQPLACAGNAARG